MRIRTHHFDEVTPRRPTANVHVAALRRKMNVDRGECDAGGWGAALAPQVRLAAKVLVMSGGTLG